MPELGVITREEEAQIAQIIDDLIDFTKFKGFVFKIIELLDGKIFLEGISYLDNTLGEKIPEDFKPLVKAFILAVIAADAVAIVETGTELINVLVDIPNITEDNEAIMISGVLQGIVAVIINFTNKEEGEEEPA